MMLPSCRRWLSTTCAVVLCTWATFAVAQESSSDDSATSKSEQQKEDDEPEVDAGKQIRRANELAGRNAITRSIPHYEKGLRAAPGQFPTAYYNLAQVWKAKEEWGKALLHYQAYRAAARTKPSEKEAKEAIDQLLSRLSKSKIAELTIDVEPEENAKLFVDGFLIARGGDLKKGKFYGGEYTLRADIEDYHPAEKTIELKEGGETSVELRPQIKTFYGKANVTVDQKDATIKFKPEDLKSPKGPDEPVVRTSPMEEPVELVTGKYLVEVTKDGFLKWVRYVQVRRDKTSSVQVELSKKLPEEIR
jgi:tetratricopeptide (TPR) repeat protein